MIDAIDKIVNMAYVQHMQTLAPTGLGQLHISSDDIDASVAFYCDVVGLPLLFRVPGQPMAFVQCGATRLYIGTPEDESFRSSPVLYLTVDDVDATHRAMCERGAAFVEEPHVVHRTDASELWMAFTRDPDGNHVAIMEDRAVGGAGA